MGKRPKLRGADAPDAAMAQIRAQAREACVAAVIELSRLAREADSESVKLAAIKELFDRGFGRAAAAPREGRGDTTTHLLVDDGYEN